jgi:hypothetical protein
VNTYGHKGLLCLQKGVAFRHARLVPHLQASEGFGGTIEYNAMNISLSSQQLRRAADLKERIEALQSELSALLGGTPEPTPLRRRYMSAAGRARIAAAQRARWAQFHANGHGQAARKPRRTMSPAAKARLAAVARARWKKAKASGKNAL